ncbi:Membrane protein OS=Streptomyces microflavus OX=1919 GN=Smic_37350 PE=3 SV=1 [Streptomyces microflavus]
MVAAIEAADLLFAVDSVPAVLAVSDDAFIVYTSNAFAILGLRALHFLLAGLLDRFHYLSTGLAVILAFIAVKLVLQASHKMISTSIPEIPSPVSLAIRGHPDGFGRARVSRTAASAGQGRRECVQEPSETSPAVTERK